MNSSDIRFSLDVQEPHSSVAVYAKRGDVGRKLYIGLKDGGMPYRISDDCTAVFTAEKPDGNVIYNACVILDNTIVYEMTQQTTLVAGQMNCEVKLYGGDGKLVTSPGFLMTVQDTVYDEGDEVESTSEFSALTEAIAKVSQMTAVTVDSTLSQEGKAADAKAVGVALAGKANTRFRVFVTGNDGAYEMLDGEGGNALAFTDIQAAIVAGKECYCKYGEYVLPLTRIGGTEAWFTASVYDKEIRVVIGADNSVGVAVGVAGQGSVSLDTTLTVEGAAADAKAVGNALDGIEDELSDLRQAIEQGGTGGDGVGITEITITEV